MAELFKFRCYQCHKMIGAPPSRLGKVVQCPRCGVGLVVPSPDDKGSASVESEAFPLADLGLNLDLEPISGPARAALPRVGPDPIAFLLNPDPSVDAGEEEGPAPSEVPDLVESAPERLVPRRRAQRPTSIDATSPRARDVVLPRTAAVAWALFALLGLAFAFTTGLFIGQRLGK